MIARSGDAICRATVDGAVWIGHLRDKQAEHVFKLPATQLLGADVDALPRSRPGATCGYRDIWYEEADDVGYLHFAFYNGAMGTAQCERLLAAYRAACARHACARTDGRAGLLVERHAPEPYRGGGQSGR